MINIHNLSISYGDVKAIRNVSLDIEDGQWVLVSGPSGCGKSTLAKAIAGIIPHSIEAEMDGFVCSTGFDTLENTLPEIAQQMGMVFQNPGSQLFHLKVEDEIAFGPRNLGLDEDEVRKRIDWVLDATGIEELRNCRPAELSGGQKQIVAIASVLAMHPKVLVLDEPTASLDLPNTDNVMETLNILKVNYGVTIFMIEHRIAAAMQRADRILLMDDGQIVVDGTPQDVLSNSKWLSAFGLRRPAELPMTPWRGLIKKNGKREDRNLPVLRMEEISAGYNRENVIKDINLSIYPGDFMALVGDNGVGKSTLGLVAAGLLKPKRGKVRFNGGRCPKPGLDVALLFQNPADQLFTDAVEEEVAFGPLNYRCFEDQVHHETLEKTDLLDLKDRRPTALSVGQQQRTALAACLALRPRLVILDEPTLGQDWKHLQRLMDFLKQLNQDGTAVLLISHDYKIVHRYANRIILMDDGRIKMKGLLRKEYGEKR